MALVEGTWSISLLREQINDLTFHFCGTQREWRKWRGNRELIVEKSRIK